MGFLKDTRAYLGGPIEHQSAADWRPGPISTFRERYGVNIFDPFADPKQQWVPRLQECRENKDFTGMAEIAKKFVRKDLAIVDRMDFLVAYLPHKVPTTGTVHEIINANNRKIPTLLVTDRGSKEFVPAWYYGFIRHEFMFGSWDCLWKYLDEVDAGLHKANDRWAFVYGLI